MRKNRLGAQAETAASPDGRWLAFIRDHNVFLKNTATDEELALTREGNEQDAYQPQFHWSPDSQKLVVLQQMAGQNREIYLIESTPSDQLQPKLRTVALRQAGRSCAGPQAATAGCPDTATHPSR